VGFSPRLALAKLPRSEAKASRGLKPTLRRAALGYVLAMLVARLLTQFLYGISPFDPRACAAVALALGIAGLAAASWPALRAITVDPEHALGCE
jgi:hypothetical protein